MLRIEARVEMDIAGIVGGVVLWCQKEFSGKRQEALNFSILFCLHFMETLVISPHLAHPYFKMES